jgi:hypothetical protein
MNRRLSVEDRVLAVVCARMFLSNWYHHIKLLSRTFPDLYSMTRSFISPHSFNIFNRLCDTLIAHVIAYGKYYRGYPFCPWIMGTVFVEHFFGLARSFLPDFSYEELGMCLARLGPKAPALAWLDTAPAQPNQRYGPGQSPPCRLGSGLAWLRPRLLAAKPNLISLNASPSLAVSLAHG